jgi:hypothetical protein
VIRIGPYVMDIFVMLMAIVDANKNAAGTSVVHQYVLRLKRQLSKRNNSFYY